jgi:hypothetical protein
MHDQGDEIADALAQLHAARCSAIIGRGYLEYDPEDDYVSSRRA